VIAREAHPQQAADAANLGGRALALLLSVLACAACDYEPVPEAAGRSAQPGVDHHVHVLNTELISDWRSLGATFSRPDSAYTSVSAIFGDAPVRAFLVSMAHIYGSDEFRSALRLSPETEHLRVRLANDHTAEQVARDPGRFVGFCSIPLLRPYAQAELERCRSELQLEGIKLHLPSSGLRLTDRSHLRILSAAADRAARERRPILIHLAPVDGELREEEIRAFIDQVVDPHPDLELYLAHLGGNGGFRISALRSIRAFREYMQADEANSRRTIYFEMSGALLSRSTDGVPASRRSDARRLARELKALGLERVVFGSDHPVFDRLEFAGLLFERLPLTRAELVDLMQRQAPTFEGRASDPAR
jgi:uncharacterized protein